jgi:hypothetical protein
MGLLSPGVVYADDVKAGGKLRVLPELTRFIRQLDSALLSEVEIALIEARLGRMHLYWPQSCTYFSYQR